MSDKTVLGIDPKTRKCVAAGRADDEDYVLELWRQGLILVPADVQTARDNLFQTVDDLFAIAAT